MNQSIDEHIKLINNKLQVLIKNYVALQHENEANKLLLKKAAEKEINLNNTIESLQQKIFILRASLSKMDEDEKKQFEKKLDNYVKEIEKCITALSE